ncbi:hypothetical protein C8R45DRAFT_838566 [Mycena sanguinolenta]|nr:hypothetical protein C8R45DRAFT_838566 [Mycena sanguinolenta]
MALPKDIPTLQAKGNGNYTHPDNVFCSSPRLSSFVSCDTAPALRPVKTDHLSVVYELDVQPPLIDFTPQPMWRKTDWDKFRGALVLALVDVPVNAAYETRGSVDGAIAAVHDAIQRCVDEHVPPSRPSPHQKRWWTPLLTQLKHESQRVVQLIPTQDDARASRSQRSPCSQEQVC